MASGAHELIDYTSQDVRAAVKKIAPGGVDIIMDMVGGDSVSEIVKR